MFFNIYIYLFMLPWIVMSIRKHYINHLWNCLKCHPAATELSSCFTRESRKRIFFKGWMPWAVRANQVGGPLRHNYCVILQRDAKLSVLSQKLHRGSPLTHETKGIPHAVCSPQNITFDFNSTTSHNDIRSENNLFQICLAFTTLKCIKTTQPLLCILLICGLVLSQTFPANVQIKKSVLLFT